MSRFRVLLTDYAWPDLDIERAILDEIDAELIVAGKAKNERTTAEMAELAKGCDAILFNWASVPKEVIAAAGDRLKICSRIGVGIDNVDMAYCTERGIPVTNVPDYCVIEVAEHALAQMLSLARKIAFYHWQTKRGEYDLHAGPTLRRIEGQTLGIVGYGAIGSKLAEKARCLGLNILAWSRTPKSAPGVQFVPLDELLSRSDYVSLHVPLTPETKHLIDARTLALMKPTAYLINTARGGVIDHAALAAALASNSLAGAALDVQDPEPPDLSLPPYNDPRVLVAPHAAFVSVESLVNLRTRSSRQVADWLTGKTPENVRNRVKV